MRMSILILGFKGLRSSLPHPLWDNKERECRRKLFCPLWIFVQVFMDPWDRRFTKPNQSFMIHILILTFCIKTIQLLHLLQHA